MSSEAPRSSKRRKLRSSSRPSLLKIMDAACLSDHLGISLDPSGSESSDKEFTPYNLSSATSSISSSRDTSDTSDANKEAEEEMSEAEEEMSEAGEEEVSEEEVEEVRDAEESTAAVTETSEEVAMVTRSEPICSVCLETSHDNDIVTCDSCGISVHEGCYGVPEESQTQDDARSDISSFSTVPWFCDSCKAGVENLSCDLCPVKGGLFKQAINGSWIHVLCGLYCEGVEYVEPELLSGITLDEIPPSKWGAKACQLCEEEWMSHTGVCIQCDAGLCKVYFHATCGQKHGLLCEAEDTSGHGGDEEKKGRRRGGSEEEVADLYFAHCVAHSDKKQARKKKAKYMNMVRNVERFKKQDDCRLSQYLLEAREGYIKFFNQMREWYHPDQVVKKGQRLLHNHPETFRLLTEKAQLLGYVPKQILQAPRRVVPVGLNVDYVNYFNGRNVKINDMKSDNDQLVLTLSQLKDRSHILQTKKKKVEDEIVSAKATCQELTEKITVLCQLINSLTGKSLVDSSKYVSQHLQEENHDHTPLMCCICQDCHDDHLMVQCDTCKNLYHITCLDPPLSRVPVKTSRYGWQCEDCCFDSEDELKPTIASEKEPRSRFGRKLNQPSAIGWQYLWDFSPIKRGGRKRKRTAST